MWNIYKNEIFLIDSTSENYFTYFDWRISLEKYGTSSPLYGSGTPSSK